MIWLALVLGAGLGDDPSLHPTLSESTEVFHFEDLLGTSCTLRLPKSPQVEQHKQAVLDEIERLRGILDSYDPQSEFSSLRPGRATPASPELREVLDACESWHRRSTGAFDPGVGLLSEIWSEAQRAQTLPSDESLERAVEELSESRWTRESDLVTPSEVPWTLDGLAKGYIIDRAAKRALESGATGIVLDIGGDLLSRGIPLMAGVADPLNLGENAPPLSSLELMDSALATSGNQLRGFQVANQWFGHVIDPRDGRPVAHIAQASVLAPEAADADALATALLVLSEDEGLKLVESLEATECLILSSDGKVTRSGGWPSTESRMELAHEGSPAPWSSDKQVQVSFAIERPSASKSRRGRKKAYKRPYLVAWVEGPDGEALRTLCLWIDRDRWLRDLRRWYRQKRDDQEHIDLVTRPTRAPGQYSLSWDGLDDQGQSLPHGSYTIVIEAAREHGSYQVSRLPIDTRLLEQRVEAKANAEIGVSSAQFGRPKAAFMDSER